jgi:hypothetical protein
MRRLWRLCIDLLANKYEIATLEVDHVKMSKECSAAIANGLQKQKDPGCPTIPCSVGSFNFEKALCDLGASVSVMPRDVFEKLRLPMEPMGICLELGDNSIRYPLGIAEDVPVKVGHHFIPIDFVVLEMGEREKPPLILGRPFLKNVGATIDVGKGEIMFDINGERSSFKFLLTPKIGTGERLICGPNLVTNPIQQGEDFFRRFGRDACGRQFVSVRQKDCLR